MVFRVAIAINLWKNGAVKNISLKIGSLLVGGIFVFAGCITKTPAETSDVSSPKETGQADVANNIFISEVPKTDFTNLELKDFPTLYNPSKVALSGKNVFVLSRTLEPSYVLQYDVNGKLQAFTDHEKIACGQDIEVINDSLFIACYEEGIYEINLTKNEIIDVYDKQDGLMSVQNLQLAADGETLWVGTFDGVAKINTLTKKVKFYREELGVPSTAFSSYVHARNGEVWVTILANAYSEGGAAMYDKKTDRFIAFGPEVFKEKEIARIDFEPFIVSDRGVFAVFQDNDPANIVVKKFNPAEKKWETIYRGSYRTAYEQLPPLETYTTSDLASSDFSAADEVLLSDKVFANSRWIQLPPRKTYLAMEQFDEESYFLVSSAGLEVFTTKDLLPRVVGETQVLFGEFGDTTNLFVSNDKKYITYFSASISTYDGSLIGYSIGAFDATQQKFFAKEFLKEQNENLPIIAADKAEFVQEGSKISIPSAENPRFIIDFATQKISLQE